MQHFVEKVVLQVDLVGLGVLSVEVLGHVAALEVRRFCFDFDLERYFVVEVFVVVRWEKKRRELEVAVVLLLEIQEVDFQLASLPVVSLNRMKCL